MKKGGRQSQYVNKLHNLRTEQITTQHGKNLDQTSTVSVLSLDFFINMNAEILFINPVRVEFSIIYNKYYSFFMIRYPASLFFLLQTFYTKALVRGAWVA